MTVLSTALAEIARPTSLRHQIGALKLLKNDIIGNKPKKETWRSCGLVELLTDVLEAATTAAGNADGDKHAVILHTVTILGSLVHGNPHASRGTDSYRICSLLIRVLNLHPSNSTLSLAALRALNNVADAVVALADLEPGADDALAPALYSQNGMESLRSVLDNKSRSLVSAKQVELVARLLAQTAHHESHRAMAQAVGLVEALIAHLDDFLPQGHMRRRAAYASGSQPVSGQVSTANMRLSLLLQAIATVIDGSVKRARFCLGSLSVYVKTGAPIHGVSSEDICTASETSWAIASRRNTSLHNLSVVQTQQQAVGPLASQSSMYDDRQDDREGFTTSGPVLQWLLSLVQNFGTSVRLMSIWIAVLLIRSDKSLRLVGSGVVKTFIPMLVQMLQPFPDPGAVDSAVEDKDMLTKMRLKVIEDAPTVLALCIDEDTTLQGISFEAGAIAKVISLLKQSSETLPKDKSSSFWRSGSAHAEKSTVVFQHSRRHLSSSRPDAPYALHHQWRVRRSSLKALAAIVSQKDEYRKSVIESSVVPLIVESLKPLDATLLVKDKSSTDTGSDGYRNVGNPVSVLLAACEASKVLCRSVAILRTSLADADLASPLSSLLSSPSEDVQIAATAAIGNVVLEFSPMRQTAVDSGVVEVLCKHGHSKNQKLRLYSLWALRHLVHFAPNQLKLKCLSDLGPGWLRGALNPMSLGEDIVFNGSAGAHVKLDTNLSEDEHEEVHMIEEPSSLFFQGAGHGPEDALQDSSTHPSSSHTNSRHRTSNDDTAFEDHAERIENLAIREEEINFVSNLVAGPASHEMADYIVKDVGRDELVRLLAGLLSDVSTDSDLAGDQSHRPKRELSGSVLGVLYIICNFAGALPRHRQLISSSQDLLRRLIPLFRHSRSEIRLTCVWIVINLTWTEDQDDRLNCKARAFELRRMGFLQELEPLIEDAVLDIQERAKQAIDQLDI